MWERQVVREQADISCIDPYPLMIAMARSSDSNFILALFRDKTFQAHEIRRVIGISVIYLVVTTALVGLFYHQMLGRLLEGMAPLLFVSEDMALANEAVPALGSVLGKWLLAMLVVNTIITVSLGIFITRRLGQPILAIKRSLREIGNGNLDVRLRASDSRDFGEISNELERAMHSVRDQIAAAKMGIEQFDTEGDDKSEATMLEAIENCRAALDYFQVDGSADYAAANDDDNSESAKAA